MYTIVMKQGDKKMKTKNAQHTPEPWKYEVGEIWGGTGQTQLIAKVNYTSGMFNDKAEYARQDANGRLMAAAPEAYKLLKAIAEHFGGNQTLNQSALILDGDDPIGYAIAMYINKAEGR